MANKKLKVGNVPNLRFPGFEGEWEVKKLGDLLDFKNGINASKEQYGRGIKFVNVSDILNNNFLTYENIIGCVDIDDATLSKYSVGYGDILFQRSSETREEVGTANVYLDKEKAATFGGFVIRGKKISNYDPNFLNNLLKSDTARNSITSRSGGSTRYNVGQDILSSVELCFPSNPEQEKIGSLLSIIDSRIETQNKIIGQLETLIKGLSEKLFSQKIRFKEFMNEWKLESLGMLGETFNGLSGKTKDNFEKGKPYIQYKQVFDSFRVQIQNCGLVEISENENQNSVQYGDIFFTISSETPDEIGMSSVLLNEVNGVYLNSFCFGYRPFSLQIINPLFASYLFRSSVFRKQIIKLAQGSTRYNISKAELMKLTILLPCPKEQVAIAQFLFSIDTKVQIEKKLLGKYQSQKQYLLRSLFI